MAFTHAAASGACRPAGRRVGALRSVSPADGRAPPGALDGGRRGRDPGARLKGRGARVGGHERAFGVPRLTRVSSKLGCSRKWPLGVDFMPWGLTKLPIVR